MRNMICGYHMWIPMWIPLPPWLLPNHWIAHTHIYIYREREIHSRSTGNCQVAMSNLHCNRQILYKSCLIAVRINGLVHSVGGAAGQIPKKITMEKENAGMKAMILIFIVVHWSCCKSINYDFWYFCVINCGLLFYILRSTVAYCGSLAGMSPANFRGHPVGVKKSWFHPGFTPLNQPSARRKSTGNPWIHIWGKNQFWDWHG